MKNVLLMKEVILKDVTKNLYKHELLTLDQVIKLNGLLLKKQLALFALTLDLYGFSISKENKQTLMYENESIVNIKQKGN